MVLAIFSSLAGLVKLKLAHTNIDSSVFRLHYQLTTSVLFIACALVAASEYIGDPIQCTDGGLPVIKPINTYCWITSTFTINTTTGLGNHAGHHEQTYHAYYQWVPFVLFFMGCLFYVPHLVWKSWEAKTVQLLLQGLHRHTMDPDIVQKRDNIVKYMKVSKNTRGCNFKYGIPYIFCEFLNLVNVIGQIILLDAFFGGAYMTYGTDVLGYIIDETDDDPFRNVFPKVTKCTYKSFGPSGTITVKQPLCILPQNILNEKVFVILWFWFVILATITSIRLVYLLVISFAPSLRVHVLEQRGKLESSHLMEKSIQRLSLGDFCLLSILVKNLDAITFRDVLKDSILSDDPNANGAYRHLEPDEEDPAERKKRMEMEMEEDETSI
ncbi:innexin inx3-like [Palaemon carinicauda]|uniref:innexin inx3-like n=1 Tax=Palaemon carinicauda TaxID=392227 RepID=UPI0035B63962